MEIYTCHDSFQIDSLVMYDENLTEWTLNKSNQAEMFTILRIIFIKCPGPCCTKLNIDGNFTINGKYHGNLDFDWLLSPVTMVVAIDGKVTISGKFYATGAQMFVFYVIQT